MGSFFRVHCLGFLLVFCLAGFSWGGDSVAKSSEDSLKAVYKAFDGGIPLPRNLSYTGHGIGIGLALGAIYPLGGEKKILAAWRGTADYYYTTFFSAGAEVLIYGGDVDSETMILYNRYRLHGRFHKPLLNNRFSLFVGPLFWFENTSIDDFNEALEADKNGKDSIPVKNSNIYDDAPEQNGFASGVEAGFGWRVYKKLGAFGGVVYEHSFVGENVIGFTGGLSFDVRSLFKTWQKNTYASWVSLEITNRRYLADDWERWGKFLLLGFHIAL